MVNKMHSRTRRIRQKSRGGRMSYISRRSRSRSASPGRISIINAPPNPEQHPQQQQPVHNEEVGPIGHEYFRFKVKCMNGETHTSPYIYSRMTARTAAREYCSTRGGVDGRIEYDNISSVQ